MIRNAELGDAMAIADIYNHFVLHSIATFDEELITEEIIKQRIELTQKSKVFLSCLVHDELVGYAYASDWKIKSAYRFTVETTIYLKPDFAGKGIGKMLYMELLKQLSEKGFKVAIGGISIPNPASIALHENLGFIQVAHFKNVGFKFNNWIDVGYWQLNLTGF
ncbi:MAG: N-acetyltransferase [Flavobacteriales bacterium]|nr:N-acetyltransferase [Flavobacteriales bacterium]